MAIPQEDLAQLAELYEAYALSLDPFNTETIKAKSRFEALLNTLHQEHGNEVTFGSFQFKAVECCRQHLWNNR